jgi:aspartyl-tRNA(Asn)/glutamyl-tRNA(Gln) amidotransferase subunit C
MSVTDRDVRHIAALARLGLEDARIPSLAAELNGILGHMEELRRVDTAGVPPMAAALDRGMPLRGDGERGVPLAHPREDFAPAMRDGLFLVPRLATHASLGEDDEA